MKLKNKIAIVTGGSQGIGEAICHAYSKEGAIVIVVNKNHPAAGVKVANKIKQQGGQAQAMICDVTSSTAIKELVSKVVDEYQRIDILVHNAGVVVFKKFEDQTVEDWNFVIDTNLKSAFLLSQAVVPHMKTQNDGKIIFVSSVAASVGFSDIAPYSASKGGMLAMTRTMVAELARYNININIVSPGNVATPINQQLRDNHPDFIATLNQRCPTNQAFILAEDIAGAAVFLASDDAKTIHGLDLIVDNGISAVHV